MQVHEAYKNKMIAQLKEWSRFGPLQQRSSDIYLLVKRGT